MGKDKGRFGTIWERLAFLLAVMGFCVVAFAVLNGLGKRAVDGRLTESLDAMAGAYLSSVEASLDYGLPVNGPGSVEEILQPPAALAGGADGLSLKLEKLKGAEPRVAPVPGRARYSPATVATTERPVLDSHGEITARLIVGRSTVGLQQDFRAREQVMALSLSLFCVILGGLLFFMTPARALLVPAVLFLPAAAILLGSFGSQLVDISRQAAMLAVADTSSDLAKADQLGISFDKLVGMQDYLRQQVGSNPAIGQIELSGPSGVTYGAGSDGLGSTLRDLFSTSPLSGWVADLVVEQSLRIGVVLRATVNVQPIMGDLSAPLLVALVLWIAGGAALWVLFVDSAAAPADTRRGLAAPALFFFLLFMIFGGQLAASVLDRSWQVWLVAFAGVVGFLMPLRLSLSIYIVAVVVAAVGIMGDSAWLLAGAGLASGVGLANTRSILKPFHLAATLVPSIGLLCARIFDLMPGAMPGKLAAVLLLVLILPAIAASPRHAESADAARPVGSIAGLLASFWIWLCLFGMQTAGHLLLALAALRIDSGLPGRYGQVEYLFLTVLLFLFGNQLAGWFGHASRLRWVLCELAVLAVVLLIAWAYAGSGNLFFNSAIAAVLMGAIVRWTATLPFVAAPGGTSSALISGVALFAFAVAMAIALSLDTPPNAALPAILVFLAAFSPLAFATIAGIGAQPGRPVGQGAVL